MNPQKTTVDWLRFRGKAEPKEILEALRPMYGVVGPHLRLEPLQRGMLGFKLASNIVLGDMPLGRMDYGGESQRDWVRVDIHGKGCEWVEDWSGVDHLEQVPSAQIRRCDIRATHDEDIDYRCGGEAASCRASRSGR